MVVEGDDVGDLLVTARRGSRSVNGLDRGDLRQHSGEIATLVALVPRALLVRGVARDAANSSALLLTTAVWPSLRRATTAWSTETVSRAARVGCPSAYLASS